MKSPLFYGFWVACIVLAFYLVITPIVYIVSGEVFGGWVVTLTGTAIQVVGWGLATIIVVTIVQFFKRRSARKLNGA